METTVAAAARQALGPVGAFLLPIGTDYVAGVDQLEQLAPALAEVI